MYLKKLPRPSPKLLSTSMVTDLLSNLFSLFLYLLGKRLTFEM
jgi:hypothetical protein